MQEGDTQRGPDIWNPERKTGDYFHSSATSTHAILSVTNDSVWNKGDKNKVVAVGGANTCPVVSGQGPY